MADIVRADIEDYAAAHTSPPAPHLDALADDLIKTLDFPQMMVGPLEGRFLEFLIFALQPERVLEIGTFGGYSSLSMAAALPAGGHVTTLEISEKHAEFARRHIAASPHADRIEVVVGPALESIKSLQGPWDFVFIDADKENYANYYDAVLPQLSDRGLIAVDNVLWSGQVVDDTDTSPSRQAIVAFNDRVRSDSRVVCAMCTIRDGVLLIRKA
jgi:caffeoyl-CoA O-methyltransferase